MKVKELIAELSKCEDQDALVILSIDQEGNNFHPIRDVDDNSGYEDLDGVGLGNVGIWNLTEKLQADGFTAEDVVRKQRAVVIWP